jgi:hypothetical protein
MKKLLLSIAAALLLCACSGSSAPTTPPPPRVEVSFDFVEQSGYATNQFAVWVEDIEGNLIQTLYATRLTANGGYKDRPDALSLWVEKSGLATMEKADVDALTGATPKEGSLTYYWDCADVEPGLYIVFVEGSLRWKNSVLYTGAIQVGGDSTHLEALPQFTYEGSDDADALSPNAPENAMIGPVTVQFVAP